ncbi:MAG TPA: tetratricopeptide repeat protein [Bryobacteraceae bacterium]|nr:tetratricopeptide repeat protein [Bryobacteraceae bacterium]
MVSSARRHPVPGEPSAAGSDHEQIRAAEIQAQVERIVESKGFRGSARLQRFLRLAVERSLAGETDQLKEYAVGRDVFDRGADYDPRLDSIVRVEARRLRRKLREYYRVNADADPIVIHFPRGSYVARFSRSGPLEAGADAASPAPPDPHTVAVLPFSNLSTDLEQQYFCDGITEDIINALTPIAELQVIGRNSMFALDPSVLDPREIGARLGAGTIVEGSVRRAGETLRVSAKIIDSETRQTKWSQVFDREARELFSIEDEIAHSIAAVLRITLHAGQAPDILRGAPSAEAHALYLKGRQAWNRMTGAGFLSAIDFFTRAIALYPEYAPPYAGIAFAYAWMAMWGLVRPADAFEQCKGNALEALRLDPQMASAHTSLAVCVFFFEQNHQEGLTLIQQALQLQPSYAIAHQILGLFLLVLGRFDEALPPLERSVHLDPLSIRTNRTLALAYYLLGRLDEAEHWTKTAIALRPEDPETHYLAARVYLSQGRTELALKAARKCDPAETNVVSSPVAFSGLGVVLAQSGDRDGALAVLNRLHRLAQSQWVDPLAFAYIECALGNSRAAIDLIRQSREERSAFASMSDFDPLFAALRN